MREVKLWRVVGPGAAIPSPPFPQVAIAGRSNVGKSSLINKVMVRRNLARTSRTPGKTRTINYFLVDDRFLLVDLPGYGYAKVSVEERRAWRSLVESFLNKGRERTRLVQLVDIRHDPTEQDRQLNSFIVHLGLESLVVATKADKISRNARRKHLEAIRKALGTAELPVPFSADTGEGALEIRRWIEAVPTDGEKDRGKT
jgi:GTP-binding protein